jgi:hypothetical protein
MPCKEASSDNKEPCHDCVAYLDLISKMAQYIADWDEPCAHQHVLDSEELKKAFDKVIPSS